MNKLLFTQMLTLLTIVVNAARRGAFFSIDEQTVQGTYYKKGAANKLHSPRPEKKYDDILGCQLKDSEYTVFFSNSWHTDLASVSFNFITNKVEQHIIPLNLNRESYFSSFIYKNKLYFITRLKNEKGIRFFTFLKGDQFTTNTLTFKDIDTGSTSFYAALSPGNVAQMDARPSFDVSTSNEFFKIARRKTKIFVSDGKLYISLDYSDKSTSVIRIDLESYESTVSVYEQEIKICGNSSTDNNSFIHKDKLFQFTTCASGINLSIRNISDGKILKQYTATDDEEISFRNSALVQKNPDSFGDEKELTTKQFIRKTANSLSFVSVSEYGKTLSVSLGGFKFNSTTMPMAPGGASVGGLTYETLFYFKSVLSKDTFDHIAEK
jgi:hypothetical protein